MTYLVLARKWRPRSFDTLIGQEHVVRALSQALTTQRLHHAWLFTGTRGVGKTTLSRILAKALNCREGISPTPCGQCEACTGIDADRYVDYLELDAASNRGVEEMTRLLEQAVYAPSAGRYKVYMIDEVHMLSGHAFNAMLKTLEEPPPHVKFILATTDPQKIPVTVLSRCLQFNLKQMVPDAIAGYLDQVLQAEGVAAELPALRLIGQAARGSMRDALSLTDQAIAYSGGAVSEGAVRGMLGTIDQRYLVRLLDALVAGDGRAVVAVADELAARSLSYSAALADLAGLLSQIAMAQRIPGLPTDDTPMVEDIRRLAQAMSGDAVQLFYSIALHSRPELALAPDEYAGFVMAGLRMLAFSGEQGAAAPDGETGTMPSATPSAGPARSASPVAGASVAAAAPGPRPSPNTSSDPSSLPRAASAGIAAARAAAAALQQRNAGGRRADVGRQPDTPSASAMPTQPRPSTDAQAASAPQRVEPAPVAVAPAPVAASTPAPSSAPALASVTTPALAAESASVPTATPAVAPSAALAQDAPATEPTVDLPFPPAPKKPVGERPSVPRKPVLETEDDGPPWDEGPPPWEAAERDWEQSAASVDVDERDTRVRDDLSSSPRALPSVEPTRSQPAGVVLTESWPSLAVRLPLRGMAAELARQVEWLGAEGATITFKVATRALAQGPAVDRLRTALSEHFGVAVQLRMEIGETGEGTAHAVAQSVKAARQREAEEAIDADPFVQTLLSQFSGEIVPGSIKPGQAI